MKSVHERLNLYTNDDDSYIFVPAEPAGARPLVVHRHSGDIVLDLPNSAIPSSAKRYKKTIYGIFGLISLSQSEYLIVITGRELRGQLLGHPVYRAVDFDVLPLNPGVSVSKPSHPVETHLLALVRSHLNSGHFLYSYEFDITRRLQAQYVARENDEGKPMWEIADDRFFWNKFLQSRFIDISISDLKNDLSPYILPAINGTFDTRTAIVNGRKLQLCLISRRSRFRAGTRYFRRGIDHDGHVANFNETEQVATVPSQSDPNEAATTLSFVQIRGSVPVFWAEINTLRYKPDLQIMDLQDSVDATRRHLQEQISLYGDQSLVNLVDQKGYEKPVKEAYERYVAKANLPQVKYQYFDFHNECKHMRWDRISLLVDSLTDDLLRDGYFHLDSKYQDPVKWQLGVVRTNSAIARWTLDLQLKNAGILAEKDVVEQHVEIDVALREMWSEHADLISKAYAGTGALKTDFTRTGKRTRQGALDDFKKSAFRYLRNNHFDGARQDAYDLMTGAWIPRKGPSSALFLIAETRPLILRAVPYILSFSLFMILAGLTLPRASDYSLVYYFALWVTLVVLSTTFILIHGIDYVAWPRLLPLTDVIHYDGPGYRSSHHGTGFGLDFGKLKSGANAQWTTRGIRRSDKQMEEIELGAKRHVD
ncbi:SacI homology domain-containing protein [Multifurca ochricompacta]|uniref:SacI homology domain-containing protein n=1 Tax=Multifurca ochricompacta TaxID=376703 RepID=A0AAD4QU69_9AGAM|nr:SacI homology domain-containing protein [Multifurca ochricompacta]